MPAGVADFIIEQGADWAVQVFWVIEQSSDPIAASGPMTMDIRSGLTGQRLIRLDNGGNGGIKDGGAPNGVIQLEIDRANTINFAPGRYVYDLFLFTLGTPLVPQQRVRLLTGNVLVMAHVTDLGVQFGQILNSGVLPPDIILDVTQTGPATSAAPYAQVIVDFDPNEPTNVGSDPQQGRPFRAAVRAGPGLTWPVPPITTDHRTVMYRNDAGLLGPVMTSDNQPLQAVLVENWINTGSVIVIIYNDQTHGLTVTRAETPI